MFNIFIINLAEGIETTLSKFADDAVLGGVDDTPEDCVTIQQVLNRLVKFWSPQLKKKTHTQISWKKSCGGP